MSITLEKDALLPVLTVLGDWGVSVPTQNNNLVRLQAWRGLLSAMTIQQRADLAGVEQGIFSALWYIPPTSQDRDRALDWNGIDPSSSKYEADAKNLTALLQEQSHWINQGLIPGPTQSSSEWPACALLWACQQLNVVPPTIEDVVRRALDKNCPSVIRACVEMVPDDMWNDLLSQPRPGSPNNDPLLFSVVSQPWAGKLRSKLSADVVNIKNSRGVNALFSSPIPIDQVQGWIDAGLDPCHRSESGEFAEERRMSSDLAHQFDYINELSCGRPASTQDLARWRHAVDRLNFKPLTSPEEAPLLYTLLTQPPKDKYTASTVIGQLIKINSHDYVASSVENLFLSLCALSPNQVQKFIDLHSGPEKVFGFFLSALASGRTDIAQNKLEEYIQDYKCDAELLLLESLRYNIREQVGNVYCTTPGYKSNQRVYNGIVSNIIKQDQLSHPQQWLDLLSECDKPFESLIRQDYQIRLGVANIFTQVVPGLPENELLSSCRHRALLNLGMCLVQSELEDNKTDWTDLGDIYEGSVPMASSDQIGYCLDLLAPLSEQADVKSWWEAMDPMVQRYIEKHNGDSEVMAMIRVGMLGQIAQQASPGTRPPAPSRIM